MLPANGDYESPDPGRFIDSIVFVLSLPVSLPAISRHLKVLERAGLISRNRSAQSRPSSLRGEPLQEANAWMETYRAIWEGRMDRLDQHLSALQADRNEAAAKRAAAKQAAAKQAATEEDAI